ncbi:MAG: toll/interleukin-1 receptor domain-containing protein, partial [Verrucomicrobiota bacterium]
MGDFVFDAFISYKHAGEDAAVARWLHRNLESFRTPRSLTRKGVPGKLRKVFRDQEEQRASANLSERIDGYLKQSEYLIVVCSTRSKESEWVGKEIARFKQLGREDNILAVMIDGEPAASFHPELLTSDGRDHRAIEPLAVDLRPIRSVRSPDNPDSIRPRLLKRQAVLKIMAALLGCEYDDLRQREQERKQRRTTLWAASATAILIVFLFMLMYANRQRAQAEASESILKDLIRVFDSRNDGITMRHSDLGNLSEIEKRINRDFKRNPSRRADLLHALGRTMTGLGHPGEGRRLYEEVRKIRGGGLSNRSDLDRLATDMSIGVSLIDTDPGKAVEVLGSVY